MPLNMARQGIPRAPNAKTLCPLWIASRNRWTPQLSGWGHPTHPMGVIWPCLNGSIYSGSTLGATHSPSLYCQSPSSSLQGTHSRLHGAPIPSLIVSELPTLHQPNYQTLSVHHNDSTTGSIRALLLAPGIQWVKLTGIPSGLDLNCNQINLPVWTTPTHDEWGGHWHHG